MFEVVQVRYGSIWGHRLVTFEAVPEGVQEDVGKAIGAEALGYPEACLDGKPESTVEGAT